MINSHWRYRLSLNLLLFCLLAASCQQNNTGTPAHSGSGDSLQTTTETPETKPMMSSLDQYVQDLIPDTTSIPEERKTALDSLANYIHRSATALEPAKLTFICTHNSRRSHMSQLWAAAAAAHYGLGDKVLTYSGGTEATAFNPRAVAAMERAGWQVESADGDNPRYKLRYSENSPALECFSKKYDDSYNPQSHFAAVMTCSHADENCPFVPGADYRVSIPYEDPKASDGTAEESAVYDERCRQIAVEMFYLLARASSL